MWKSECGGRGVGLGGQLVWEVSRQGGRPCREKVYAELEPEWRRESILGA